MKWLFKKKKPMAKTISDYQEDFKNLYKEMEKDLNMYVGRISLSHACDRERRLLCSMEIEDPSYKS